MLLEETPSGNLLLFRPENRDAGVRMTRGDVRTIADAFALLDRWARGPTRTRPTVTRSLGRDLIHQRGAPWT